jgi:hypothetical protein
MSRNTPFSSAWSGKSGAGEGRRRGGRRAGERLWDALSVCLCIYSNTVYPQNAAEHRKIPQNQAILACLFTLDIPHFYHLVPGVTLPFTLPKFADYNFFCVQLQHLTVINIFFQNPIFFWKKIAKLFSGDCRRPTNFHTSYRNTPPRSIYGQKNYQNEKLFFFTWIFLSVAKSASKATCQNVGNKLLSSQPWGMIPAGTSKQALLFRNFFNLSEGTSSCAFGFLFFQNNYSSTKKCRTDRRKTSAGRVRRFFVEKILARDVCAFAASAGRIYRNQETGSKKQCIERKAPECNSTQGLICSV